MTTMIEIEPYCEDGGWYWAARMTIDGDEYHFSLEDYADPDHLTYGAVREMGVWDDLFPGPDTGEREDNEDVSLTGYRGPYGDHFVTGPFRDELCKQLAQALDTAAERAAEAEEDRRREQEEWQEQEWKEIEARYYNNEKED